jgi:hypothetical protein
VYTEQRGDLKELSLVFLQKSNMAGSEKTYKYNKQMEVLWGQSSINSIDCWIFQLFHLQVKMAASKLQEDA